MSIFNELLINYQFQNTPLPNVSFSWLLTTSKRSSNILIPQLFQLRIIDVTLIQTTNTYSKQPFAGKAYAMQMMKTVAVHILRRFRVRTSVRLEDIQYELKVVMHSRTPLLLRFEALRSMVWDEKHENSFIVRYNVPCVLLTFAVCLLSDCWGF